MKRDSRILKIDHTFRMSIYSGKVHGTQAFNALFTATNEYEEIVMQTFTPTTGHDDITNSIQKFVKSQELLGHPEIEYCYTDNCCKDRQHLQKHIPSLTRNVVPVKAKPMFDGRLNLPRNDDDSSYFYSIFPDISTDIRLILEKILSSDLECASRPWIILDVQWSIAPDDVANAISLIQLSINGKYYLFRQNSGLHRSLRMMLQDQSNTFVAINAALLKEKLHTDFGVTANIVDIRSLCKFRQLCSSEKCGKLRCFML